MPSFHLTTVGRHPNPPTLTGGGHHWTLQRIPVRERLRRLFTDERRWVFTAPDTTSEDPTQVTLTPFSGGTPASVTWPGVAGWGDGLDA